MDQDQDELLLNVSDSDIMDPLWGGHQGDSHPDPIEKPSSCCPILPLISLPPRVHPPATGTSPTPTYSGRTDHPEKLPRGVREGEDFNGGAGEPQEEAWLREDNPCGQACLVDEAVQKVVKLQQEQNLAGQRSAAKNTVIQKRQERRRSGTRWKAYWHNAGLHLVF